MRGTAQFSMYRLAGRTGLTVAPLLFKHTNIWYFAHILVSNALFEANSA